MTRHDAIIITGAAGFIGSCLVTYLNERGYTNLILADDFSNANKDRNLTGKQFSRKIPREKLFEELEGYVEENAFFYHIGARTDTTEFDYAVHEKLNVVYSKKAWEFCVAKKIPLVYASSAATYGAGELGYWDEHSLIPDLQPLNPYGVSKNEFDKWVLEQISSEPANQPPGWAGLKFFNVYGPNEYHKGRMASVIFHSFNQIKEKGFVKLFRSHRPDFKDGEQLRDFIYVMDVLSICCWFLDRWQEKPGDFPSGIYNVGTGEARSFIDLVNATFSGIDKKPAIEFIDMPEDIRDTYQYFTEAEMKKIEHAGYNQPFHSLEKGVDDYIRKFLSKDAIY